MDLKCRLGSYVNWSRLSWQGSTALLCEYQDQFPIILAYATTIKAHGREFRNSFLRSWPILCGILSSSKFIIIVCFFCARRMCYTWNHCGESQQIAIVSLGLLTFTFFVASKRNYGFLFLLQRNRLPEDIKRGMWCWFHADLEATTYFCIDFILTQLTVEIAFECALLYLDLTIYNIKKVM